jgi:hypothetical protein
MDVLFIYLYRDIFTKGMQLLVEVLQGLLLGGEIVPFADNQVDVVLEVLFLRKQLLLEMFLDFDGGQLLLDTLLKL